jgi:glycosyltransferase involved in cell wall biosynthesis
MPITYINALSLHQGGGLVLLKSLIKSLNKDERYVLVLDSRVSFSEDILKTNMKVKYVKRNIFHRFFYEVWFRLNISNEDKFFSLTNLPPIFRLKSKTILYVHNRYLVERDLVTQKKFLLDFRVFVERWILKFFSSNVDNFFVQTYSMKELLINRIPKNSNVHLAPFLTTFESHEKFFNGDSFNGEKYDFLYVSSGEFHKNHIKLFEAWQMLADEGIYPSLCLTLNRNNSPELCFLVDKLKADGLNIFNVGIVEQKAIRSLYDSSVALIYPSKMESFGLPLLEASYLGMPILASELDFVRDLVDPTEVFDPNTSKSIARAVKRFLKIESSRPAISDAKTFFSEILCKFD